MAGRGRGITEAKKPQEKNWRTRSNTSDGDFLFENLVTCLAEKLKERKTARYREQGALPKKLGNDESGSSGNILSHPQRNTSRSPYKWYKSPNSRGHEARRKSSTESLSSLDSNVEESRGDRVRPNPLFPFYYVVPDNPTLATVLPPGKYLVIPQKVIPNRPLQVVTQPKRFDKSQSKTDDDGSGKKNPEKKNKGDGQEGTEKNENGERKTTRSTSEPPQRDDGKDRESSVESKDGNESSNPSKSELSSSSDGEVNLLAFLIQELPYLDEKFIKSEWSRKKPEESVETFLNQMREIRTNQVFSIVMEEIPNIDPEYLTNKIPEIFYTDEDVNKFVKVERAREKFFSRIRSQLLLEFDEEDVNHVVNSTMGNYDSFGNAFEEDEEEEEEENIVSCLKDKLTWEKENKLKMHQLQMILAILPDVDADFVLNKINSLSDYSDLDTFIAEMVESQNYPKAIETDPKFRDIHRLWSYYVTNYSVENYLKKVPDPEKHFSDSSVNDRGIKREIAICFLEKRYPDLDNFQVASAFQDSGDSIVKTCNLLDKNYLPELSTYKELDKREMNEAFLQEITFIVHKDEILKHLRDEKERRELELLRAEEEKSFFECLVCFSDDIIPSDVVTCSEGHVVCRQCVISYIETSFGDGKFVFPCLSDVCDTEYSMKTIEKLLKPEIYMKITQVRAAEEVDKADVPGLEKCPSCNFAYIPPPEDKIFTCLNEDCGAQTCRLCKEPNHIPLACNEIERPKDLLARKQVEEAMTEKLVRSCPTCRKKFIKIDGCNKITCTCGTNSCYICLAVVTDYRHFNGQGGSEFHKCPLFSNNEKLHWTDVLRAGIEMKQRIKRENPDINFVHDPTGVSMDDEI